MLKELFNNLNKTDMQEKNKTLSNNETGDQRRAVRDIVEKFPGEIRTDQVRIAAFKLGISCADVYLRELARENKIARFWKINPETKKRTNQTKHWSSLDYFETNVKPFLGGKYAQ